MNSRIISCLAFLSLLGGLQARTCGPITTVGRYVVVCSGFLTPAPNSSMVPSKILGTVSSDESGTFTGTATVSIGGVIISQSVTGKAKLSKDCTGTISYTQTLGGQPGPPLDISAVVSEQGNRIDGLTIDPGAVMSCALTRMSNTPATVTISAENRSPEPRSKDGAESKDLSSQRAKGPDPNESLVASR
jgi:hypothetical protein